MKKQPLAAHIDKQLRVQLFALFAFVFFFFGGLSFVLAEGTTELRPAASDAGFMQIWDPSTQPQRRFMTYSADSNQRLYINICNQGERIYFGFRTTNITQVTFFRLRDPNGNIVFGPVQIPTAAGPGLIDTYAQAVAGPSPVVGAAGYNALDYTPVTTGNFYVEFNANDANTTQIVNRRFELFDITVATIATNTIRRGRMWSRAWDLTTGSFTNQFKAFMFMYAPDGVVTRLDFNGIQPFGFIVSANGRGCTNTGNIVNDRRSRDGNFTYPDYPIFLNDPDSACFPTGILGDILAAPTITGCNPASRCLNVVVNKSGIVNIFLELNGIVGYQENSADLLITINVDSGSNCITWNSRNGLGQLVLPGTVIPITVDYFNGLTHLPMFDVENHPNGYRVALTRPIGPQPRLYWDDTLIAGGTRDPFIGCVNPTGCHNWSGSIAPNGVTPRSNWGDLRSINTWWFASARSSNASIPNAITLVDANRFNPPIVPNDTIICSSSGQIPLNGVVSIGASTGIWSTTGSGIFLPNDSALTAVYQFGPGDVIPNGFLRIRLTSTNDTLGCPPQTDSLLISFAPPPTSVAGPGATVCFNNAAVTLSGSGVGGGAFWTGGSGQFLPDSARPNPTYLPSPTDLAAGGVFLRYISEGVPPCVAPAVDSVRINYINPIAVVALGDTVVCRNNPVIQLNGSVTVSGAPPSVATGGRWSGGAGVYTPHDSALNATYIPSASEIALGTLRLFLRSRGSAFCQHETDTLIITFIDPPSVNAGADRLICNFEDTIFLSASTTPTVGGFWSGGAGGTFVPNSSTPNARYSITNADSTAGIITLVYTTVAAGGCSPVRDTVVFGMTPAPMAEAGPNVNVCATNPTVNLNGNVTMGAQGIWSTSGDGVFLPNANSLNATYQPGPFDILSTVVLLYLNTTGASCTPTTDSMLVVIGAAPRADAGPNQTICSNNPVINLTGVSLSGATATRQWSGGAGTFSPNPNQFAVSYNATPAEISSGSVKLFFRVSTVTCPGINDSVTITFVNPPAVNAGPALVDVCTNNPTVSLSGTVTGGSGGIWSNGTGIFLPNSTVLNPTYTASPAEIATGGVTLRLTSDTVGSTCFPVSDTTRIRILPGPTVNAGPDQLLCANNAVATLAGTVTNASSGRWIGGTGTFSPTRNQLNVTYTPSANELTAGFVNLILETVGNGICTPEFDTMRITFANSPLLSVNAPASICEDNPSIALSATFNIAGGVRWFGNGGSFIPNADSANVIYIPTPLELINGTVNLTVETRQNGNCIAAVASRSITVTQGPDVNAGPNQIVCGSIPSVTLNGSVIRATGGTWTSSGTGSFLPNVNILNPTYQPSNADRLNGFVVLKLVSTGNGNCNADSATMAVTFTSDPTVNAGPDKTVCSSDFPIQLEGSGSAATWFGGNGSYSPNPGTLNARYTPSTFELLSGTVTLRLVSNPNPNCPQVADTVRFTLRVGPSVNAGPDRIVCANEDTIQLNGTVANSPFSVWTSTGTGIFVPNPNNPQARYVPSATDKLNGVVRLVLSVPPANGCGLVRDTVRITINPSVVADAGPDQNICVNVDSIRLNGTITLATGGVWTSVGGGAFFPADTARNARYVPTSAERAAGVVRLRLTTTGNGSCQPAFDTIRYTLLQAPGVNPGTLGTFCADVNNVPLNGTFANAAGLLWSTSGSGVFSPNANTPGAAYFPSAADADSGGVWLRLTSLGNGTCAADRDSVRLILQRRPRAIAGADINSCANIDTIPLLGQIQFAASGVWFTSGTGIFIPNATALNARYIPSALDKQAQFVSLRLTTVGNGTCTPDSNSLGLTIRPIPQINAGLDIEMCETNSSVALSASITDATGVQWFSNGTGSFTPSNTVLTPTYQLTFADRQRDTLIIRARTTGTGVCTPVTDTLLIRVLRAPTVNAGADFNVCRDQLSTPLNGSVINALSGSWSSATGGGFFPNAFSLNPNYVFTIQDRLNGFARLFLASAGNGPCIPPPLDTVIVTLTPQPTIQFTGDTLVCSDTSSIQLNALVTVATGGIWRSTGTGTFSPADTGFVTNYIPSSLDRASGFIRFTFETTGNGICDTARRVRDIHLQPAPIINAGPDLTICRSQNGVTLNGTASNATGVLWGSLGSGGFVPFANTLNPNYLPAISDRDSGFVRLVLQSTNTGICKAARDTMRLNIRPLPTLEIGNDTVVCSTVANIRFIATQSNAGGVQWSTTGGGTFLPNSLSDTVFYIPAANDTLVRIRALTQLNGECAPVLDTLTLRRLLPPIINAGIDKEICSSAEGVDISGTVSNALGLIWSTNGTGVISDTTALQMTYQPSAADRLRDTLTFFARSVTNGVCANVTDVMLLTVTKSPTVNAGQDFEVCASLDSINVFAQTTQSPRGQWITLGTGVFTPSDSILSTFYKPSIADTTLGGVQLVYTAAGNGSCFPVTDTVRINFVSALAINAGGPVDTVCTNDFPYILNGSGASGTWTGGAGVFNPSRNVLNATYTPTAGEIAAGQVSLTLTSPPSGVCPSVSSNLLLRILPGPTLSIGGNRTVCADTSGIPMGGSFSNVSNITWTSSGTGTFLPNNISASVTYVPSPQDIQDSSVTITATGTSTNACSSASSQFTLFIRPAPSITAGPDISVCRDVDSVLLQAFASNALAAVWRRSGSPALLPANGPNNYSVYFTPTFPERTVGFVNLVATTDGIGTCKAVSDTLRLTLTPLVGIDAPPSFLICENRNTISLKANLTVATGAQWATTGTGTFSPSLFNDSIGYSLSASDVLTDSITFRATTTENGTCRPASDSTIVRLRRQPTITVSSNQEVCRDVVSVQLGSTFTNAQGIRWKTLGSGSFNNDTITNARYFPSAGDVSTNAVTLYAVTRGTNPCDSAAAFTIITFRTEPSAIVNAGFDISICRDVELVNLNGLVLNAPGGTWSTSGSGDFLPTNTSLNGFYRPSASDKLLDSIFIRLTSLPANACSAVTDSIMVRFTPIPTVNAGLTDTICADASFAQLNGQVTVALGGVWTTSGTGTFVPNAFSLNAVYQPSSADRALGQVGLTLTTDGNGTCNSVSAGKVIRILPTPEIILTSVPDICADQDSVALAANIIRAAGVQWITTGTGIFLPGFSSPNIIYLPSAADKLDGSIVLIATTIGNGKCQPKSANRIIRFVPPPLVEAGPSLTICEDAISIQLNGSVSQTISSKWSTTGTGVFAPSEDVLSPTYTLSLTDRALNTLKFTLRSEPGQCKAKTDSVFFTIQKLPVVNTGPNILCVQNESIRLNGTIQNAMGGVWSTTGTGTFSPSTSVINPLYFPSATDFINQRIDFFLTSIPTGACSARSSEMVVAIAPPPFVDAGLDKAVCRGSNVLLSSFRTLNNQYRWSTLNNLTISNGNSVTVTVNSDTAFIASAIDVRGCVSVDTIVLRSISPPVFNMDTAFCFDTSVVVNSNVSGIPLVPGTFLWYRNDTLLLGSNNSTYKLQQPGIHRIVYFFDQCITGDTTNAVAPPVLSSPDPVVCVGSPVRIETNLIQGGVYIWSSGAQLLPFTTHFFDTVGNQFPAVNEVFSVNVVDIYGCAGADSIVLRSTIKPDVDLPDTSGCQGIILRLNGSPINRDSLLVRGVYTWFESNQIIPNRRDSILSVTTPGIYKVRYALDACFDEDSVAIVINPLPQLVVPTNVKFCKDDDDSVAITVTGFAAYQWSGPGIDSTDTLSTVFASDSGYVRLTVLNVFNCPTSDSILILDRCTPRVFVPSGFTPNGDGKDDVFRVFGNYLSDFSMTIYSRWGEVIFYETDIAKGWDGTYKGDDMPIGTYPVLVTYKGVERESLGPFRKQASVTLIR